MAGGHLKHRHLSRDSSHRKALLRNLVTSLFKHETITTTWPKAKEAQRIAEKLVTMGKKNTEASRRRAAQIFFEPLSLVPKLINDIAPRYLLRPGGYTRCLRLPARERDAAPLAMLSLVDGPRDMRYFLTAQTVARDRCLGQAHTAITEINIRKCTNGEIKGKNAEEDFEKVVQWYMRMEKAGVESPEVQWTADTRPRNEMMYLG